MLCDSAFAYGINYIGKVFDKSSGKAISYAIITLADESQSANTNSDGFFDISLTHKKNMIICECIGYCSDTLIIDTSLTKSNIDIYLKPCPVKKISVKENIYSASQIVDHAKEINKQMLSELHSFEFEAYNRCVTRENNGVGIGTGSIQIDPGIVKESVNLVSNIWKTKPMKINGITEFISKDYYKSPDLYNEVIGNLNSREGLPPSLNSLTGNRRIQNLCGDELLFFDRPVPGPLSSSPKEYYKYSFKDTLFMNNDRIFKIHFEPVDKSDPGLTGFLYIDENTGHVLQIEANLNLAANTGNNFDNISLMQQYIMFNDSFYLPLNYYMSVSSNYVGIVKIQYDYSALINKYKINEENLDANQNVTPHKPPYDQSVKDSNITSEMRAIPFTNEEASAYTKIDSIRSLPKGFFYNVSRILAPQYRLSDHYSISGPLGLYQFNHVEGHTISFTGEGNNLFENTLDARLTLSNGFSDKRFKESLSTSIFPDNERNTKFSFDIYNKLAVLFSSSDMYRSFTTTILSLLSRHDFRGYYYTSGFDFRTDLELSQTVRIYAAYSNHVDHSAKTNTTFSLLGNARRNFSNNNSAIPDSVNPAIYDTHLNTITFGINFDFRDNVIQNNLRRRDSFGRSFISFGTGILISDPKYLGSDIGFISYNANILGEINTFGTSSIGFSINGIYSNGPVPFQMQYALPGNINATGRSYTFRTLGIGNMFGDQVLTLSLEYNFRREIYRLISIPILQSLSLNSFFNAALKNISDKSAAIMPITFSVLTRPLFETGFSIGYASLPVSLEFAWRLTHVDRSAFRVGFNTSIL